MKLQFASDLHLENHKIGELIITPHPDADILILAGDIAHGTDAIMLFADWPVPVLYVPGNHEYYHRDFTQARKVLKHTASQGNVQVLDNDVIEISGVRFLGCTLWSDYKLNPQDSQKEAMAAAELSIPDHQHIYHNGGVFTASDALFEHERACKWLDDALSQPYIGKTVVISHHAPTSNSIHARFKESPLAPAFASELGSMLTNVDVWFHGHLHDSSDYLCGHCRVLANPCGYHSDKHSKEAQLRFENRYFQKDKIIDLQVAQLLSIKAPASAINDDKESSAEKIKQLEEKVTSLQADYDYKVYVLQELLANFPGGVSLIDRDLKFIAWNDEMLRLLDCHTVFNSDTAPTLEISYRRNIRRGEYGDVDEESHLRFMLERASRFEHHKFERIRPDGTVLEIRGDAIASGGFVTTYQDITDNFQLRQQLTKSKNDTDLTNTQLKETLTRLQKTQRELIQSEKLASLGVMVTGIAHELNTPTGNSLLLVSTLLDKTLEFSLQMKTKPTRQMLKSYIENVLNITDILNSNLQRTVELVKSFKRVSVDRTSAKRRIFNLNTMMHEIMTSISPTVKKTPILVEYNIPPDIQMDSFPGPLGQVIANIVNNAILHAFEDKEKGSLIINAQLEGADHVTINIQDNGKGIDEEHLAHIFDPFFTTRLGKGGSGLGLSISQNITQGILGGSLHVESELGKGTLFSFTIPINAPQREDKFNG